MFWSVAIVTGKYANNQHGLRCAPSTLDILAAVTTDSDDDSDQESDSLSDHENVV